MLGPYEVSRIEKALELLRTSNGKWASIKILEQLLKETKDDIDDIASIQQTSTYEHIGDVIPRVLAKLKKETGYGIPEKDNISTKPLQRNKDRTSGDRTEWNKGEQAKRS